jgi:hypothetical protein
MFKLFGISTCILALAGLIGCSGNSPVEVKLKQNPLNAMTGFTTSLIIEVSSTVDQVKVNSVVINRGNCHSSGSPAQLKFGQNANFHTSGCDVKEVEVDTDDGSFTFTF